MVRCKRKYSKRGRGRPWNLCSHHPKSILGNRKGVKGVVLKKPNANQWKGVRVGVEVHLKNVMFSVLLSVTSRKMTTNTKQRPLCPLQLCLSKYQSRMPHQNGKLLARLRSKNRKSKKAPHIKELIWNRLRSTSNLMLSVKLKVCPQYCLPPQVLEVNSYKRLAC